MPLTTILAALAVAQAPATPPRTTGSMPPALAQTGKRVTLRFNDASLKDVLNRLQKEKVSYVVDAEAFKGDRVSLNLIDVPLEFALNAVATALDAHWETVGSVRVLKRGAGSSRLLNPGMDGAFPSVGPFRAFEMPPGFALPKDFVAPKLDVNAQKEASKALADAQREIAKAQGMGDEPRKAALKALEEAQKNLAQSRSFFDLKGFATPKGFEGFKNLSPQENEAYRKAMERIRGTSPGTFRIDPKAFEEMTKNRIEFRTFSDGDVRKAIEKARGSIDFSTKRIGDLLKSLTPEQKELQKKQGYLKVSDLTDAQREFVGIKGDGKTEITVVREGETLKIKGE